uniref:CSON002685 protein n=1 Tax=Culicoides sonorensis TaxID=179676 RepID=A0A336M4D3_CULSO
MNSAENMDGMGFMSLEEARRTQRPYRYGMILLCLGALVNWLGLAENYSEPVRYAGVACILMGGLLICTAMCCWLHTPNRSSVSDLSQNNPNDDQNVHIITINERTRCEKPPDYEAVTMEPPSYDDAIKLNPSALLPLTSKPPLESNNNTVFLISSVASQLQGVPRPSSSLSNQPNNDGAAIIDIENTVTVVDEKKTSSPNEIPR